MTGLRATIVQVQALQPQRLNILVVEDELLIRIVISDALRDEGFAVIEASNGDEAVDILLAGKTVDLIFSDVRMPGKVDGLGLVTFVSERFPEIPVILTSGHLEPGAALAGGARDMISKPYEVKGVVSAIAKQLAKRA